ncbi:hypothetical protein AB9075_07160 [Burkholderia thailandensis]|uniref:hypothetical protein n=1 Tax=Burkholderia thailandensis TaxID=57975 RepID=UPI003B5102AF
MATITQFRGALLEEAVLFLLRKVGYAPYDPASLLPHHASYMRSGRSGLEVRGRGTWHQLDAFALWQHSPAFMYPLHLVVEAKCYASHRPVGVEIPRNSVGVLKDISENYFTYSRRGTTFQGPRYNYTSAIFSTSGFTQGAVEYAIAHQVFLIQYESVPAIQPLINAILNFDEGCINLRGLAAISAARSYYRDRLVGLPDDEVGEDKLTRRGRALLSGSISEACRSIGGSYFGMLQGQWPLHLLRRDPLPPAAFIEDTIQCEVHGNNLGEWSFSPIGVRRDSEGWFELEFSLPTSIAELVSDSWQDPVAVANIKQRHFSYIDLTGIIGGIRRSVRLELNHQWIEEYIQRRRR